VLAQLRHGHRPDLDVGPVTHGPVLHNAPGTKGRNGGPERAGPTRSLPPFGRGILK
jgi:hypothetical protein